MCICQCAVSNRVILSAVVGSLSCALLLVVALGVTYRFVRAPSNRRPSRHISPITAIEEQIYAQRSAPPPYPEAMATSRPYDDYRREIMDHANEVVTADNLVAGSNTSDDDLLDVGVTPTATDGRSEDIVIALDCLAHWQRQPKPVADSSESSLNAIDNSQVDVDTVYDAPVHVDATETLVCDTLMSESTIIDDVNTDDDTSLLVCWLLKLHACGQHSWFSTFVWSMWDCRYVGI